MCAGIFRYWTGWSWKVTRLPHNGDVYQTCFSPDGRRIATAAADTTARVYELGPGAPPVQLHRRTP